MVDQFVSAGESVLGLEEQDTHEEPRFSEGYGFEDESVHKSLEDLTREGEVLKKTRRTHQMENMKDNGASSSEAMRYTMDSLKDDRNGAIHQVLQQRGIYMDVANHYQQQRDNLSPGIKVLNKVTSLFGYKLPSVNSIEDKKDAAEAAMTSVYNPGLVDVVKDSARYFLDVSRESVEIANNSLRKMREEREVLTDRLESLKYKASERADHILELENKMDEYNHGIEDTQANMSRLKRTNQNDLSDEDKEALSYFERVLDSYKSNRKTVLQSIRESEEDLSRYHAQITATEAKSRRAAAIEGKFDRMFAGARANLEQAEVYMSDDESNVGYLQAFEIMESLAGMNQGVTGLLVPLDSFFRDSFDTMDEVLVQSIDTDLDNTLSGYAESCKQNRKDLVEMYKSREKD